MGNLTTFTIYNDGLHLLEDEKNAIDFVKKLLEHAKSSFGTSDIPLGNFANFCKAQRPKHSSDEALYVHSGNTVIEMNPYPTYTTTRIANKPDEQKSPAENLYYKNKNFFKEILELIVSDAKALVDILKEEDIKQLIMEDSGVLPNKKLNDKDHQELVLKSFQDKDNESLAKYIKLFN